MKIIVVILSCILAFVITSLLFIVFLKPAMKGKIDYSKRDFWYDNSYTYDKNKIDVFYCLSTTLIEAFDNNGRNVLNSTLCIRDREIMNQEYKHISTNMFDSDHFNFIAPYYRQMTFETYDVPNRTSKVQFLGAYKLAKKDIFDAFDYYMKNINNGRPFILAGFSQGAVLTENLLKYMSDEQYSRLIASYTIGFEVNEKHLKNKHIKPATGADDLGVTISYNSVESVDHVWEQIERNPAVCINPLNWKTDDTPAELIYDGDKATVHVDQKHHLLVVEGLDSNKYDGMGYPIEKGIYHMWDIRFYADAINKNAIHRAELFMKKDAK